MKLIRAIITTLALAGALLPAAASAHPAQELVQGVTEKFIAALGDPAAKTDGNFVRQAVERDVVPHIDFESMTKLTVGGKNWKTASAEQRTTLIGEFQKFLLNTYTQTLDEYTGQSMEFLPYKAGKRDDRAEVQTLFNDPGASSQIPVDYKLHNKQGPWMIYDIKVEQVSLVLGYKSEFSNQIKKGGIDRLIQALKDKNK